jgi:hypothetical protein
MPGVGKRGRPGPSAPHIEIGSVSPFRHSARSTDCAKRRTLVTRLRGVNGSCALWDRHAEICLDQRTDATLVALIRRALAPAGRARRDANPRIGSPSGNGFAGCTRRRTCSSTSWARLKGAASAPDRHPFDLSWPHPAKDERTTIDGCRWRLERLAIPRVRPFVAVAITGERSNASG